MKAVFYVMLAGFAALAATTPAHAQGMNMPMGKSMASDMGSKPAGSALPVVNGQVRKLDPVKGTIVLQHDEIPNLGMPPMSMEFSVADKKLLGGLKAGDRVRFQCDMVDSRAVVTMLERAK